MTTIPRIRSSPHVHVLLAAYYCAIIASTTTSAASAATPSSSESASMMRPTSTSSSRVPNVRRRRRGGWGGDDIVDEIEVRRSTRSGRRTLTSEERLDILRLGFVPVGGRDPPSSSESESESSSSSTTTTMTTATAEPSKRRREDAISSSVATVVRRTRSSFSSLSTSDCLDILRLGFTSPSSSNEDGASSNHGNGGDDGRRRRIGGDSVDRRALSRIGRGGGGEGGGGGGWTTTSVVDGGGRSRRTARDAYIVVILSFLAGLSNAVCHGRYDCYPTMMTGNTISASTSLSLGRWDDVIFRTRLICGYAMGTAIAKYAETTCMRRRRRALGTMSSSRVCENDVVDVDDHETTNRHRRCILRPGIVLAPIVAMIFGIADAIGRSDRKSIRGKTDVYDVIAMGRRISVSSWDVPLLAVGYGMIYSISNRLLNSTMTHVVTGHLTKLGESLVSDMSCLSGILTSVRVLISFVCGVVLGVRLHRVSNVIDGDGDGGGGLPIFTLLGVVYASVLALI
jgi:uncharacterized membrane protein YoaK (UPF0700 family)